jgi:membrane protein
VVDLRRPDRGRDEAADRAADRGADDDKRGGMLGKIEHVLAPVPVLRRVVPVHRRYGELNGNPLAAAFAFQAFLALFPLMLVAVAVVGFISANGSTDPAARIISELGLTGDAADSVRDAVSSAEGSRRATSIVGFLGLCWSALGLVAALQFVFDQVWQVEARGVKDKAIGMMWLAGAALLFVAGAAATTLVRWLPGPLKPLTLVLSVVISVALWLWAFRVLPNATVPWRSLLPGAIFGAIGFEVLKAVGAIVVPNMVESSSQLYGTIGIVLALLGWLLFFGRLVVYAAVVNVVLHEARHGTVETTIEIPRVANADSTDDVTRAGRVTREDARN